MKGLAKAVLGAVGLVALVSAGSSDAAILSYYNFNDSTAGTGGNLGVAELNPDAPAAAGTLSVANLVGTNGGSTSNNYGVFTGSTLNALNSDPSGLALAITGTSNNSKFIEFSVPTTGLSILSMTFASQRTSTGFSSNTISYSTDGGTNFLPALTFDPPSSFGTISTQLVNGSPLPTNTLVRVTLGGATGSTGNIRLDNVQFADSVVPEPGSLVTLGGLVAAGLTWRRRRCD